MKYKIVKHQYYINGVHEKSEEVAQFLDRDDAQAWARNKSCIYPNHYFEITEIDPQPFVIAYRNGVVQK